MLVDFAQNLPEFLPEFAEICRNSKSRRIPNYPIRIRDASGSIRDASGIGTNSAGVCVWRINPHLASSSRSARGRSPRFGSPDGAVPESSGRFGAGAGNPIMKAEMEAMEASGGLRSWSPKSHRQPYRRSTAETRRLVMASPLAASGASLFDQSKSGQ